MVGAYSAYLKMFSDRNGSPLSNKDFNERQIAELRQAVYNKMFENDRPEYWSKVTAYNNNPYIKDRDKINTRNNAVGYGNYPPGEMANILGRFYFNKDKNGNITISDSYDFNNHNAEFYDPRFLPIILGRKYGVPYNININLGNPNTWGNMKYTGNKQLGI